MSGEIHPRPVKGNLLPAREVRDAPVPGPDVFVLERSTERSELRLVPEQALQGAIGELLAVDERRRFICRQHHGQRERISVSLIR